MSKIHLEDIQKEIENDNWKLISQEYKNLDSELIFECKEGHRVYSSWKKIRSKRECPICKKNQYNKAAEKIILPKKKNCNRILALDQATYITGFSIFDDMELIHFGIYETRLDKEIERDYAIKCWLLNMIENWKPDYIGIEGLHFEEKRGVTTFETLARLQGILMETLYEEKVPFIICPAATWREFSKVKGKTRSDKKRSAELIAKKEFDITLSNDAAEAILIGKYVANKYKKQTEVFSWE